MCHTTLRQALRLQAIKEDCTLASPCAWGGHPSFTLTLTRAAVCQAGVRIGRLAR